MDRDDFMLTPLTDIGATFSVGAGFAFVVGVLDFSDFAYSAFGSWTLCESDFVNAGNSTFFFGLLLHFRFVYYTTVIELIQREVVYFD